MTEFNKLSSNEWGAPYKGSGTGPLSGIEQRDSNTDKHTGVAAALALDEERQIQGVDIQDQVEGSLDDLSAFTEEEREQQADESVARAARANRG